jgi:hypothetical protein
VDRARDLEDAPDIVNHAPVHVSRSGQERLRLHGEGVSASAAAAIPPIPTIRAILWKLFCSIPNARMVTSG